MTIIRLLVLLADSQPTFVLMNCLSVAIKGTLKEVFLYMGVCIQVNRCPSNHLLQLGSDNFIIHQSNRER